MRRLAESLRVAVAAALAHKLRSSLTLTGVVIGVATIVAVIGAISGLDAYVQEQIFTLRPDVFIITRFGVVTSREEVQAALRRKEITRRDLDHLRALCTGCRDIGAVAAGSKALRAGHRRVPGVQISGSTANLADLFNLDLAVGRFFTASEVARASPVAVVGWDVRDELFPGIDPLGRIVTVEGYPLTIIGVLRRQGAVFGRSQDNVAWIPLSVQEKVFGRHRSLDLWVRAASVSALGRTEDEVRVLLRRLRGTPWQADDPFGVITAENLLGLWRGISAAAFAMMGLISGISLLVGGIVIMNIMLVSVAERTHEIGIRLSVGARRRDILLQFLLESGLLAGAGGAAGAGLGLLATRLVSSLTPLPTRVGPALFGGGLLLAVVVGVAFGLFPALRAARLDPIEALRSE